MADFVEEHIMRHEWTGNVDNISFEGLLVRCKDCKNATPDCEDYLKLVWCRVHERRFIEEWYCADGERREEE